MATILTVDDSPSIRQMIRLVLAPNGHVIVEAGDGSEGLEKAKAESFDLVVTDLNMPVMNGMQMIRGLRALPSFTGVPIVFLTTESDDAVKQEAKAKQILLVVPYPAGGAVDLAARLVAEKLRLDFGQSIVVENRPGANGMVGAAAVARAQPDGYTLLMAPREVFGINPILMPQQAIDGKRDFAYIGVVATGPYVLVVNPGLGVNSFAELAALAKQRELAYASFGKGSMAHLNIEALARRLGVKMVHVPYRGAPPAVTAVATGEVALTITTPPAAISLMQDGKLKAIAVGSDRRLPQMNDVPTMAELGLADDPLIPNFFGLVAPARTPAPIVERLNAAAAKAITAPEIAAKLEASGLVPAPGSPSDMARLVNADVERFGRLIRELDIKVSE